MIRQTSTWTDLDVAELDCASGGLSRTVLTPHLPTYPALSHPEGYVSAGMYPTALQTLQGLFPQPASVVQPRVATPVPLTATQLAQHDQQLLATFNNMLNQQRAQAAAATAQAQAQAAMNPAALMSSLTNLFKGIGGSHGGAAAPRAQQAPAGGNTGAAPQGTSGGNMGGQPGQTGQEGGERSGMEGEGSERAGATGEQTEGGQLGQNGSEANAFGSGETGAQNQQFGNDFGNDPFNSQQFANNQLGGDFNNQQFANSDFGNQLGGDFNNQQFASNDLGSGFNDFGGGGFNDFGGGGVDTV